MLAFQHFGSRLLAVGRSLIQAPSVNSLVRNKSSSCSPLMEICGKSAIVTGAANGMGYSITHNLLANGAKVLMVDLDGESGCKAVTCLSNKYGKGRVDFYHGDVACEAHQQALFKRCRDCFGQVNIVVNNASVWDETNWTKAVEVNFKAVMESMMLAFKYLTSEPGKRGGTILNISSTLALKPRSVSPVFSGTKSAVLGLTRSLSDKFFYNKHNIRMFTLCPGITHTSHLESARHNMPTRELKEEFDRVLAYEYKQNPEVVGAATIHLIREAPHGSTWIIEDGDTYMIDFPPYECYRIPSTSRSVCNK